MFAKLREAIRKNAQVEQSDEPQKNFTIRMLNFTVFIVTIGSLAVLVEFIYDPPAKYSSSNTHLAIHDYLTRHCLHLAQIRVSQLSYAN